MAAAACIQAASVGQFGCQIGLKQRLGPQYAALPMLRKMDLEVRTLSTREVQMC